MKTNAILHLHKVQFENDDHIEETYDSIKTLTFKYNFKSAMILRRTSEEGKFKNGILVLDIINHKTIERHNMVQNGLFKEPIINDIVAYYTLHNRKCANAAKNEIYRNLNIFDCFVKYNNE